MVIRTCLLALAPTVLFAQGILRDSETYEASTQFFATVHTPFWMQARQYGVIAERGPFLHTTLALSSDYQIPSKTRPYLKAKALDWGYAFEVSENAGATNQLLLPQSFVKVKYRVLELSAGKRRELTGIADSTLGMGPYSGSGNAMSIPKIQLALRTWTRLFTPHLAIRASLAHGWLEDPRAFVRHAYLHQKTLYLRIGKPKAPVLGFVGMNHQVQWAGRTFGPVEPKEYFQPDGSLPHDAAALVSVVTGKRGFGKNYNLYDNRERVGNHLGSVDLALQMQSDDRTILMYRQQPYEMPSLLQLANLRDGLMGISVHNNAADYSSTGIRTIVFEYLSTQDQGRKGPLWGTGPVWQEQYFNHLQYRQGWSYRGRTIGVPFITPSKTSTHFTNDNLLTVFHLGIEAFLFGRWELNGRLSHVTSRGTPDQIYELPKQQVSFLIEAKRSLWFLKGSEFRGTLAGDAGNLYPKSVAVSVGLTKRWGFVNENVSEITRYRLKYSP